VRRALLIAALLTLAVVTSASGQVSGAAPELTFTASIGDRGISGSAVCVGSSTQIGAARRLTRTATSGWFTTAWSPDGARIAIAGSATMRLQPIRVARADGSAARNVSRPRLATEEDLNPAWSPDGTQIAFARYVYFGPHTDYRRGGIWIVDLRTGRERQVDPYFGALAWSPTGDVLATDGSVSGEQVRLLTPDGRVVRTFAVPGEGGEAGGFAWSPDGTRLALGGGMIVDRDGRVVGRYAPPSTDQAVSHSPAWSPNGSTIVYARAAVGYSGRPPARFLLKSDLFAVPAGGGTATRLTDTPDVSELAPEFRPAAPARAGTSQPCVLIGTARGDSIRGTRAGDLIAAGAGADRILAGGGNDVIAAGSGADFVNAGPGGDRLFGGRGNDRFFLSDGTIDVADGFLGRDVAQADRTDRLVGVETRRR
jgi:WD40 repeat protein